MKLFWSEESIKLLILNCQRLNEKFLKKEDGNNFLKKEDLKHGKNGVSYADLETKIAKLQKEVETLKNQNAKIELSDGQLDVIVDRVMQCIHLNEQEKQQTTKELPNEEKSSVKYPPPITKSGFPDNLSNTQGDSYFRFFNIENNTADLDYCGKDFERAKANKTELEQACEVSGSTTDAHKIVNVEKGTVALKDGKWEVTNKAKIKFE